MRKYGLWRSWLALATVIPFVGLSSPALAGVIGVGLVYQNGVYSALPRPSAKPQGGSYLATIGINDDDQFVGEYNSHAFLLSGGTYTTLNNPLGPGPTEATGINNSGEIVGTFGVGTAFHGFLDDGGIWSKIDYPGADYTFAMGINDFGDIVGFYSESGITRGFLYRGGLYSSLSDPGAIQTLAEGINNSGQIVGDASFSTGEVGFLYDNGPYVNITDPSAFNTQLHGINASGISVGNADQQVIIDDGGSLVTLPAPPSNVLPQNSVLLGLEGYGINDLNQVVITAILETAPEPQTWISILLGFTFVGISLRRARRLAA